MKLRTTLFAGAALLLPVTAITAALAQEAPPPKPERPGLERLDTDKDGRISREEATAENQSRFAEADTNGDGGLSLDEMITLQEQRRAERQAKMQERRFSRMDQDGDGLVSIEEFSRPANRMFERADLDENGVVTETELRTMEELRRQRRGKRGHGRRGPRGDQFGEGRGS
ncbi:MAG: EF-hand domain-containing protein [Pseudomonadota bacterium]